MIDSGHLVMFNSNNGNQVRFAQVKNVFEDKATVIAAIGSSFKLFVVPLQDLKAIDALRWEYTGDRVI